MGALTAHYGSPGRLADYRRQFERTIQTALEMLVIKAFGDMGQTARLHIIRDRFVAGHDSCELRRHLDSVPPETPIRDIVDSCQVWESHADSDVRRLSKPGPDRALPTYMVGDSGCRMEDWMVAAVTISQSTPDQLGTLLRRLLPGPVVPAPPPKPEPSTVEQLLRCLLAAAQARKPALAVTTGSSDIESASRESGSGDTTTAGSDATRLGYSGVFLVWQSRP